MALAHRLERIGELSERIDAVDDGAHLPCLDQLTQKGEVRPVRLADEERLPLFRWCDNLSNNDPKVLTFMSKAFASMVVQMAFDTKVMSASNNVVYKKKLPIASDVDRHPSK